MNKYAGKHPKLVPNRNLGFMNKPVIEIGLDQTFGKSAIYNQGGGAAPEPIKRIQIIGGNPLNSGIEAIIYAESCTPGVSGYNADIDVIYEEGLGNGWLFINGQRQPNRVLVRHDFIGDQTPLMTGRRVSTSGTTQVSGSGGTMTAYIVDWI